MICTRLDQSAALRQLSDYGDPVEQRILQSRNDLAPAIDPYAMIWARHVYPRRDEREPWRVESPWMRFAGSHYTALIRVYQTLEALERILQACETFPHGSYDAESVMNLHDATESFWHRVDQAIDHLGYGFEDAPFVSDSDSPRTLNETWDRSEFDQRDTLLAFYGRVPAMVEKQLFRTFYPREWQSFLSDISSTWWELCEWLQQEDTPPTKQRQILDQLNRQSLER